MCRIYLLFIISVIFLTVVTGHRFNFKYLNAKTTEKVQEATVIESIQRLIPNHAHLFTIKVEFNLSTDSKDVFTIKKQDNGNVLIEGNNGVAAASGFHHYLKYYCDCHISWDSQQLRMPKELPFVNETIKSNGRFRYYQNVCTTSYSFAWWNWQKWESHIDWMAFNGINLPLAFTAQEAIWQRTFKKLNFTDVEIDEHFTGPAFFAWERMGNLRGWAGPLSENWHNFTINLQHKILNRMRDFGMVPVIPGFAGHVPRAMKRIYPNSTMTPLTQWLSFEDEYCCPYMIDPKDPLFVQVGEMFLNEYISEFGSNNMYSCDPFNEMVPTNDSVEYIKEVSSSIFNTMAKVDPLAVWVLQNWMFVNSEYFWSSERVKAFMTAVPIGRILVLDLMSEQYPKYNIFESYFGQPFIWCMLHNFGGTLGMHGSMNFINKEVFDALSMENSTMVGIGLTPEGINQNYVIYDLMLEMGWRKKSVDLFDWFHRFSNRRYGEPNEFVHKAVDLLITSVYDYTGSKQLMGQYVINSFPELYWKPCIWYNVSDILLAWDNMILASEYLSESSSFKHDLVDLTRQVLQVQGDEYYVQLMRAFSEKNLDRFRNISATFLTIFDDLEEILATSESFLLGKWLESAKSVATTNKEEKLYEYNARNQITLWGPRGEINNYASKQWSGIVSHVFLPRWKMFVEAMNNSLETETDLDVEKVSNEIFSKIEKPFTLDTSSFSTTTKGDTIEIARKIHRSWKEKENALLQQDDLSTPFYDAEDKSMDENDCRSYIRINV